MSAEFLEPATRGLGNQILRRVPGEKVVAGIVPIVTSLLDGLLNTTTLN